MQGTESMDLKHSETLDSVADNYIPNSKSTDLIKPTKLNSQQPSGENFLSDYQRCGSFPPLQNLLVRTRLRKKVFSSHKFKELEEEFVFFKVHENCF